MDVHILLLWDCTLLTVVLCIAVFSDLYIISEFVLRTHSCVFLIWLWCGSVTCTCAPLLGSLCDSSFGASQAFPVVTTPRIYRRCLATSRVDTILTKQHTAHQIIKCHNQVLNTQSSCAGCSGFKSQPWELCDAAHPSSLQHCKISHRYTTYWVCLIRPLINCCALCKPDI